MCGKLVWKRNSSRMTGVLTGPLPSGSMPDAAALHVPWALWVSTIIRALFIEPYSPQSVCLSSPPKPRVSDSLLAPHREADSLKVLSEECHMTARWLQETKDRVIERVRVPRTPSQREVLGAKPQGSASQHRQGSSLGFTWSVWLQGTSWLNPIVAQDFSRWELVDWMGQGCSIQAWRRLSSVHPRLGTKQ